jgi:hypothetical protein
MNAPFLLLEVEDKTAQLAYLVTGSRTLMGLFFFLCSAAGTTHSRFAPVAFLVLVTFCAYAPLLAANREP